MKKMYFKSLLALLLIVALLLPVAGVAEELPIDAVDSGEIEVAEENDLLGADESSSEAEDLLVSAFENLAVGNVEKTDDEGIISNAGSVDINSKNFPDKWFREIIEINYDLNDDGKLSDAEIAEVYEISIVRWDMEPPYELCTSLKGIEFFYNLEDLTCWDYEPKTLDVSKNKKLVSLLCDNVGLTKLNISGNKQLAFLDATGNNLVSIDIGNCPKLVSLVRNTQCEVSNGVAAWGLEDEEGDQLYIDADTMLTAGSEVLYGQSMSVKLSKESVKLGVKEKYTLAATVTPSSEAKNLRFKTSNKKIATVDSKTGKITAKKKGTATISATLNGKVMAKCQVTVKKAPSKVTLNKTKVTINAGNTYQLTAKIPSGTYTSKYTWKSSNEKVATVDNDGLVTGVKKGSAKITVKTANGKSKTCKVTVKAAKIKLSMDLLDFMGKNVKESAKVLGWTAKQEGSDAIWYTESGCRIEGKGDGDYDKAVVDFAKISEESKYNINGIKWGDDTKTVTQRLEEMGWILVTHVKEGELEIWTWGSSRSKYDFYKYTKDKLALFLDGQSGKIVDVSVENQDW